MAGRKRRERPCRWREAAEPRAPHRHRGGKPGPLRYSPGGQRLGCGRGSVPGAARYPAPCSRSAGNPRCAPLVPVPPPSFSALLQLLCLLSSYRWVRCPCQVGSSPVLVSGFPVLVSPSLALSSHPSPIVIWALSGVPQHLPQGLWAVGSTRIRAAFF